jgi:hypothetical protein
MEVMHRQRRAVGPVLDAFGMARLSESSLTCARALPVVHVSVAELSSDDNTVLIQN